MVAGWVAFAVYTETAAGHALDGKVRSLEQQNAALRAQVDAREREISAAQTSAWLEEQARRLGYVMPGEKVYVLATPGAAVPPEGGVDASPIGPLGPTPSPGRSTPTPAPPPDPAAAANPSPTPYQFTVPPGH